MKLRFKKSQDPIDSLRSMIRNIQRLVGVNNVLGDENYSWSIYSILATISIPGAFLYLGLFSQFMYVWQVWPDKVTSFQAVNCISATFVPFTKYIFMWISRNRLKNIFTMNSYMMSLHDENSAPRAEMVAVLRKARNISWLVVINIGATHAIYLVVPSLLSIFGQRRYLPSTPGTAYGLSPKYETPYYELNFIITVLATAFSVINQNGYIVLFVTLIATEIGQLLAFAENLRQIRTILYNNSLSRNEKNRLVQKNLIFCVKQHQFLFKYHEQIHQLYRHIFGVHFFIMTANLVATLQTFNTWDLTNTLITGFTGILPLFLYCFGGEWLLSSGLVASSALYSCGWEAMNEKHARMVHFMIRASQKPLTLTAAGIFVMNRATFGRIVQIIYRICTVLKSDDDNISDISF